MRDFKIATIEIHIIFGFLDINTILYIYVNECM